MLPTALASKGKGSAGAQIVRGLTWLGCSQRMFSGFRSLWAMPRDVEQGVRGEYLYSSQGRGQPSQPDHTFVMQEVQGTGHVLHHHTGLQLVKVASPVDVAQDGPCGAGQGQLGHPTDHPAPSTVSAPSPRSQHLPPRIFSNTR